MSAEQGPDINDGQTNATVQSEPPQQEQGPTFRNNERALAYRESLLENVIIKTSLRDVRGWWHLVHYEADGVEEWLGETFVVKKTQENLNTQAFLEANSKPGGLYVQDDDEASNRNGSGSDDSDRDGSGNESESDYDGDDDVESVRRRTTLLKEEAVLCGYCESEPMSAGILGYVGVCSLLCFVKLFFWSCCMGPIVAWRMSVRRMRNRNWLKLRRYQRLSTHPSGSHSTTHHISNSSRHHSNSSHSSRSRHSSNGSLNNSARYSQQHSQKGAQNSHQNSSQNRQNNYESYRGETNALYVEDDDRNFGYNYDNGDMDIDGIDGIEMGSFHVADGGDAV